MEHTALIISPELSSRVRHDDAAWSLVTLVSASPSHHPLVSDQCEIVLSQNSHQTFRAGELRGDSVSGHVTVNKQRHEQEHLPHYG